MSAAPTQTTSDVGLDLLDDRAALAANYLSAFILLAIIVVMVAKPGL